MSVISDLLGIDHFTTSRGGTVRSDFLQATAQGLGVPLAELDGINKDDLIVKCVVTATGEPMDPTLLSIGGTVTNAALQRIVDGITARGVPGKWSPTPVPPDSGILVLDELNEQDLDLFDPVEIQDERDRRLLSIAARQGRDRFRAAVFDAYDNRCAVTSFDAVDALEAAHIYPYRGPATNAVTNGLCLRADVHALFDRGALSVNEITHRVTLKPHLSVTRYADLNDVRITLPRNPRLRPSTAALRSHREWAGL